MLNKLIILLLLHFRLCDIDLCDCPMFNFYEFYYQQEEIAAVLKLGVKPSRIVYANPCKQNSYIRYAAKENVDLMTFDNEAELYKVKIAFPRARWASGLFGSCFGVL